MTPRVGGIHHVTCIAGDAQENLDFYAGLLGMRLVKRSVNQDDPGTYHLFYADAEGHPGSDLTFFPWPGMGSGREGTGLAGEVALAIPPGSLAFWRDRLEREGIRVAQEVRFGEPTLTFRDPHGLRLALAASPRAEERAFAPWRRGPIAPEHQVRGIHAARVVETAAGPTQDLATRAFGMRHAGTDGGWDRYEGADPASGCLEVASAPGLPRGQWGVGKVHHVAWRVADDAQQRQAQDAVRATGLSTTHVIDRFWFRSVYFREPGGVLFELATDGPGFGVDEPLDALGETLVLPPWLEPHRARIEAALPPLDLPHRRRPPPPAREA
ncbi:MAG TPA: ring-cleaving dioxygenase [Candidatus Thermoplasmatota archaeon]|nr:ring-cleaving dioxygenase [Candidatus Thermoplasmatota archaeon]